LQPAKLSWTDWDRWGGCGRLATGDCLDSDGESGLLVVNRGCGLVQEEPLIEGISGLLRMITVDGPDTSRLLE
jgi:hypothetical protein